MVIFDVSLTHMVNDYISRSTQLAVFVNRSVLKILSKFINLSPFDKKICKIVKTNIVKCPNGYAYPMITHFRKIYLLPDYELLLK